MTPVDESVCYAHSLAIPRDADNQDAESSSSSVISIMVRRNPMLAKSRCAASFRSAAMLRVDYDVVQHTRRPAQCHVVVPFDSGECVADHIPVVIGDEDGLVRIF